MFFNLGLSMENLLILYIDIVLELSGCLYFGIYLLYICFFFVLFAFLVGLDWTGDE